MAADINPNAALNAAENARANGLGDRVAACAPTSCGACAAPALRRDPVEPAQACGRAARSRRSRLARRSGLPRRRGPVRPGARAPEARRTALRHGVVGFRPRPVRQADRSRPDSARASLTSIRSSSSRSSSTSWLPRRAQSLYCAIWPRWRRNASLAAQCLAVGAIKRLRPTGGRLAGPRASPPAPRGGPRDAAASDPCAPYSS